MRSRWLPRSSSRPRSTGFGLGLGCAHRKVTTDRSRKSDRARKPRLIARDRGTHPTQDKPARPELPDLSPATLRYIKASSAPNTVRGYKADLKEFNEWCAHAGVSPLPATPATVANYISRMADDMAAVATIERRLAAIAKSHKGKAAEDPTVLDPTGDPLVRATLQGIKRQVKDNPDEAKPLTVDLVARILADVPTSTNAGRRDRALVLIGFYGAFRRSELSSLMAEAVLPDGSGVVVEVATPKGSQSEAVYVPIAGFPGAELGPVKAVNAWRDGGRITRGPLLRPVDKADQVGTAALSPAGVSRVVRRLVRRAGLADADGYSAHSLRAGFVTTAKNQGLPEDTIMRHTRHKSVAIMRRYDRRSGLWVDNAGARLGPPPTRIPPDAPGGVA
jgi:integrase